MKIRVVVVGETDQKDFKNIENQYIEKIKRYVDLTIKTIKDPGKGLKLPEEELKKREAKLILEEIKKGERVFLLDENGKNFNSKKFAEDFLRKEAEANTQVLVLVIGGPYGFHESVKLRSEGKISLSPLTFTHQMVRMILYEQLYRGYSILRGEKYHHE